ncbi:alcohol dehydrogenase catalytic domain-containing protein [Dialister invisus]|uniref:alcohol dehydrogenase catalytic domain-containing protein n=1 Tax=Dialister invisus TaxID=218538 RepID=UPI0039A0A2A2
MKGYAMLKIGSVGWVEKEKPACGAMDAICKPLAIAICTSDVHTVWEGAVGERHDMILGHECCAEVVEVGADVKISNRATVFLSLQSPPTGIRWKPRQDTRCTPAECWQAGNFLILKTACLQNISM